MKEKDLKCDTVYYFDFGRSQGGHAYIGRILNDGSSDLGSFLDECGKSYRTKVEANGHGFGGDESARPATKEEIKWLEACEKANEYVAFKDVRLYLIQLIQF